MYYSNITKGFLLLFLSSVQPWVLPPGSFLSEFAISHDRASITIYLPTRDISARMIRNHQKSVTKILNFGGKTIIRINMDI